MMQLPLNMNFSRASICDSELVFPSDIDENTDVTLSEISADDYEGLQDLWSRTEKLNLGLINSQADLEKYLHRNSELSWVAKSDGKVIGALLCGHDGIVGYIHHLAVDPAYRRLGIGKTLVITAVAALEKQDITRCNIVISKQNTVGANFWNSLGWSRRKGVCVMRSK